MFHEQKVMSSAWLDNLLCPFDERQELETAIKKI